VYKSAGVQRILRNLIKVAWEKQVVPRAWHRAGGVFIPKENVAHQSVSSYFTIKR